MQSNLSEDARNFLLELIRQEIARGNNKLPTEREIAAQHIASYGTIRLVTAELEKEGFIRKIRGSGTYITPQAAELLEQLNWRELWFFRSPISEKPDCSYSSWLTAEIRKVAAERQWKLHEITVTAHERFFEELKQVTSPGDAILYLPPIEPFSVHILGEFARYDLRPLIVIDCEFGDISISNVTTDNRFGGMLAARQLLEHGYRELGIVLSEPHMKQQRSRLQGFRELAEIAGASVEVIDARISYRDDRADQCEKVLSERISRGKLPEALFVTSDAGANGVLRALEKRGIVPGKDIALISFDGVQYGSTLNPSLATIVQPVKEIARTVFDMFETWEPGLHPQRQLYPYFRPGGTLGIKDAPMQEKPYKIINKQNFVSIE
ncbi:MAG: substrate-binding domain-containing protein [Lentisphaeria bacterium]|nr:substrate-binding domain-containing protein [Lentisphaeria bacterium]